MSFQPPPRETPNKPPKGKVKGARRVINLSEEQRRKKRENDRLAQQAIRRRNKETIDSLRREVEMLRSMRSVETALSLHEEIRDLRAQLLELSRCPAFMYNERHSHPPASTFEEVDFGHGTGPIPTSQSGLSCVHSVDGPSPAAGHSNNYSSNVPHSNFGSSPLPSTHRYDHWQSHVVPLPSPAVNPVIQSVESSPGPCGPGKEFGYMPTSVPVMEPAIIASNTSAPALHSIKLEPREADSASAASRYPSPKDTHSSPAYLHAPPWCVYSGDPYYLRTPSHRHAVQPTSSQIYPTMQARDGRAGESEEGNRAGR
ncbi:uncharacterized protein B0T15DRAFT_195707 [Chaetomium strumarium]|uniref:BZIP domain-containing protein n=1 Tax=Chaetomium strumarium TaxID=1170767 RepID=A0AAJ0GSP2_9PEZI|nr:hypothetical protein B0T15DRAFT_195707 [Chaetomium strumarium]